MVQKKKFIWVAPLGVFLVLSFVFICYGLFPYGNNTLAWGDMTQQVIPLLLEMKQILLGSDSLSFTHLTAGGMNFFGVFLFFLCSPFSFLVVFIPNDQMILWVNIFVIIKLMVCACCAQYFFIKKFPNLSWIYTAILGISYALCGYVLLFYQNLIWLDFITLFPLLILAIDYFFETRKTIPFILVFSAMLVINLYLSYMLVLFLILLCGIYMWWFVPKQERGKYTLSLAVAVFLCALVTAPAWLPFLIQYQQSARGVDLLTSLSDGKFFCDIRTTFFIILVSPLIIASIILPVHKESSKKKFLLVVFLLMVIPLVIDPINRMWHTGSYQAFPARYGFITVFIGLILTAMMLNNHIPSIAKSKRSALLISVSVFFLFVGTVCSILWWMKEYLDDYVTSLWVSDEQFACMMLVFVAAFISYFTILFCWQNQWITSRVCCVILSVTFFISNIFYSSVFIGQVSRSPQSWQQAANLSNKISEENFYRVKMSEKWFDVNLLGGMGYPNLGHYTSLTTERYLYGMKKLGYSAYWMEVSPVGGTALTDAILCNQFIVEPLHSKETGNIVASNDRYQIREIENTLPVGMVTEGFLPEELTTLNRAEIQELLYQSLFGQEDSILTVYNPSTTQNVTINDSMEQYSLQPGLSSTLPIIEWKVPVKEKQALYFDCFDSLSTNLVEPINKSFDIAINHVEQETEYPSKFENGLLYLGTYENEIVAITATLHKKVDAKSFGIYGMDLKKLQRAISNVKTPQLSVQGGTIKGVCEAKNGQQLFLPISYDNGFEAKVNGRPVSVQKAFDCFMAIPLEEGTNTIEINYHLPGLKIGLLMAVFGLVGVLWIGFRKQKEKQYVRLEQCSWVLLKVLMILVLLLIYIAPVGLWLYSHYVL